MKLREILEGAKEDIEKIRIARTAWQALELYLKKHAVDGQPPFPRKVRKEVVNSRKFTAYSKNFYVILNDVGFVGKLPKEIVEHTRQLYIVITEKFVDYEKFTQSLGNYAKRADATKKTLYLHALDLEDPEQNFVKDVIALSSTFIHEFTHFIQDVTGKAPPFKTVQQKYSKLSGEEYYSHPSEYDAFFVQYVEKVENYFSNLLPTLHGAEKERFRNTLLGANFNDFKQKVRKRFPYRYRLSPKYEKKFSRRLYKIYDELRQYN